MYSEAQILYILENYNTLSEGKRPSNGLATPDYGCRIQTSKSLVAVFERPIQLKSDIDRAIKRLKPTEKGIITNVFFAGFSYTEVAYWWDMDPAEIRMIEKYTIGKIQRYLNQGEKRFNHKKNTKKLKFSRF